MCAPRWSPWRTFVRDARKVSSFSPFSGSTALICAGSLRLSSSLRNFASRSCATCCRGESFLARAGCTNSSGFASRIFIEPSSNYASLATIGGASDLHVQLRRAEWYLRALCEGTPDGHGPASEPPWVRRRLGQLESGGLASCLWAPMVGRAAKSDILLPGQGISGQGPWAKLGLIAPARHHIASRTARSASPRGSE